MDFKDLNLHGQILKAVEDAGYSVPTPIQEEAIPLILSKNDLLASAPTGTGKTAAFILPSLQLLTTPAVRQGPGPRVLILVPTRELAMQVAAEATKYSKHLSRMKTVCIFGGTPYPIQKRDLSRPYEILVATPGRLIDHIEQGRIQFSRLEMFILDEADRMLDMGFIEPVEFIASEIPHPVQTLMFSATLKGNVLKLSQRLLKQPKEISVESAQGKHENIEQQLHYVDNRSHKHRLLDHLLKDEALNQAIIFTSTKMNADQLADKLCEDGFRAAKLHGDMNQRQRTRTISQLRQGKIRVLVATDVAARGIDVQSISHVINFDLPTSVEDYVHRIGRTGRADAKGIALTFATSGDAHFVRRIEQYTGKKMVPTTVPGMEPKFKIEAKEPSSSRQPRRSSGMPQKWGKRKFKKPFHKSPSKASSRAF